MSYVVAVYVDHKDKRFAITAREANAPQWAALDKLETPIVSRVTAANGLPKSEANTVKQALVKAYEFVGFDQYSLKAFLQEAATA